jgi:AraC-like DNA-binding protein
MRPADPALTVFSTAGLPAARRVELWETHNATALIGLDVHAADPLEATEFNVQLGQVHLARVTGSAHSVERTAAVIDRSPADAIAVYLTLRGDAWFGRPDGTRTLRPGHVMICQTDQPFSRGFTRGLDELVVKVPGAAVTARAGAPILEHPVVTAFGHSGAGDPYATALAKLAGRATRTEHAVPADERTVLDLVTVLAAGRHAARAVAHRAAACSVIEEHLTDPGLGAGRVAAAIGISDRQLSRVFAADGTSVPRYILSRRLELAHAMLASMRTATVADIAARCGFTSAAYFSHVFRDHFGERAGDVRRGVTFLFPPSAGWILGPRRRDLRQSRKIPGPRQGRCARCLSSTTDLPRPSYHREPRRPMS